MKGLFAFFAQWVAATHTGDITGYWAVVVGMVMAFMIAGTLPVYLLDRTVFCAVALWRASEISPFSTATLESYFTKKELGLE
jgi:hypothetical protein